MQDSPKRSVLLPAPEAEENAGFGRPPLGWRRDLFHIIFESNTRAGRIFDLVLLSVILASVAVVMLDSVRGLEREQRGVLGTLEWMFTVIFTVEYIARLVAVQRPLRYATSFFGIVDLMAVLPTYLAYFFPEMHALIDIRVLRMLRVFRILKLTAYITEYRYIAAALYASRRKIFVFLSFVLLIQVMLGTVMYVVEGPKNGFTSIPVSIYWGISAMTTVGFGDIVPKTGLGRFIASIMMLLGWGILAVPTGIVTAEMTGRRIRHDTSDRECSTCGTTGHAEGARHCQDCGALMQP
ncbi:MAG TPA: ion transporter [Burkholderiales bacterium]|nr:ion transporter [Burkholderiales bacterium]